MTIARASTAADFTAARAVVEEYAAGLGAHLCLEGFTAEIAALGQVYGPPRGVLLLARAGDTVAGCVAARPLAAAGACEMKRLYVRPAFRGLGLGRDLAAAVLDAARTLGYRRMLLDTLDTMTAAHAVYAALGFGEVAARTAPPSPGVRSMATDL